MSRAAEDLARDVRAARRDLDTEDRVGDRVDVVERPSRAARTIDRVWLMFMRSPVPYGPPVQPVLTSHAWAP